MKLRTQYLVFAVVCIICLACCSGCAVNFYRGKEGGWLFRGTLGTDQQVGVFILGKDGELTLGGSQSKQSESVGSAAGAVTEAMKPKILP